MPDIGCIGDLMTFGRTPRCSLIGVSRYSIIEEGKTCGQESRRCRFPKWAPQIGLYEIAEPCLVIHLQGLSRFMPAEGITKAISSSSTAMAVRSTKSKAVTMYFKAFLVMLPRLKG
jgi:hypothetical protein